MGRAGHDWILGRPWPERARPFRPVPLLVEGAAGAKPHPRADVLLDVDAAGDHPKDKVFVGLVVEERFRETVDAMDSAGFLVYLADSMQGLSPITLVPVARSKVINC